MANRRTRKITRVVRQRGLNFLTGAARSLITSLQSPGLLIGLVLGYYYFEHTDKLKLILSKLEKTPIFGAIFKSLEKALPQVAGALAVTGGTFTIGNPANTLPFAIFMFFFTVYFIPAQTRFLSYGLLAVFITAFLRAKSNSAKIVLAIVAIATVAVEVWPLTLE
jgi:hypothetical protein